MLGTQVGYVPHNCVCTIVPLLGGGEAHGSRDHKATGINFIIILIGNILGGNLGGGGGGGGKLSYLGGKLPLRPPP